MYRRHQQQVHGSRFLFADNRHGSHHRTDKNEYHAHDARNKVVRTFQLRIVERVGHHRDARPGTDDILQISRRSLCHSRIGSVHDNLMLQLPAFRAEHDSSICPTLPQKAFHVIVSNYTFKREVGIVAEAIYNPLRRQPVHC